MNQHINKRTAIWCVLVCELLFFLLLRTPPANATDDIGSKNKATLQATAAFSYENATISEDITWKGTVLVTGGVVIAPQTTVRIEPGTTVRFLKSDRNGDKPRMVIKGRLQAVGTPERPVLFAAHAADGSRDGWGGLLFLSSEKRNQLDHVRIEGAETGIEGHFSSLSGDGLTVRSSRRGMSFRDSTVTLASAAVSGCDAGLDVSDSEVEIRDGTFSDNRLGIFSRNASLMLSSLRVKNSELQGLTTLDCRVKLTGCEFSGNGSGASFKGGEGQVTMCRFTGNREAGVRLSGARIRFHRNVVADNSRDGLQVEDGRSVIWDNAFSGNGGYNLANVGNEEVVAVLNWWGVGDVNAIRAKIFNSARDNHSRQVAIEPWLSEKPSLLPERL